MAFFNQGDVSTLDGITGVTLEETFVTSTISYTAIYRPGASLALSLDMSRPAGTSTVILGVNGGVAAPVIVGAIDPVTGVAALESVTIASGTNVFTITVTSPDTSASTTYTLSVTGTVLEPDINTSASALTVAEGSTTTFTVRLDSEPTASVTVTPSASDASEVRFIPASLSFSTSTWRAPQTVTVAGVYDTITDGTQTSILTLTASSTDGDYSGITSTVGVTITDTATTTPAAMDDTIFNAALAAIEVSCLDASDQDSIRKGQAGAGACVYYSGTTNYGHISDWNTSAVTNMFRGFQGKSNFDQNISGWNTASVTNMSFMFDANFAFNQDISGWDTSNVTTMSRMFSGANVFNQDISGWNVSNVTDMSVMFFSARAFNQGIGGWDVSSVTGMNSMFSGALAFNQNISGWDVSSVTSMRDMFNTARVFNADISGWDVSSVRDMLRYF